MQPCQYNTLTVSPQWVFDNDVDKTPDAFPVRMKLNSLYPARTCTHRHRHPWKLKSRGQSSGKMLKSAELYLWLFYCSPLIIQSSHFKMYCQQISPFVQLPYRFLLIQFCSLFNLIVKYFPSNMQSTFSKHSSKPLLLSAILNLYDENLTSLWLVGL